MKTRILSAARLSFALPSIALALLASGSLASAQTVSLDFESETAGSSTVPAGWSYLNSGLGAAGTYATTAADGGSTGAGLGGLLVSQNGTHGTKLPFSFLVNSGSAAGFDLNRPISGTYDFKHTHKDAYDSSAFLFGDISGGTISGSDAGQLLLAYHSNGGYGNAPSHIVDGANGSRASGGGTYNDNTWYRVSFTWTPTSGTKGNFTRTSTVWNGSSFVAHGTLSATGFTFNDPEAFIGVADLWATNTTFDNLSATGTEWSGVYWDTNGTTAGAGNPADGTWDGTAKWNSKSDGTDPTAAWTAGDVAVFAAGSDAINPYTVTVSGTHDISGLMFGDGTPTLTGGTLRMTSDAYANVASGTLATIASTIADDGSARVLSTGGAGTLVLSGNNSGATNSSMNIGGVTQFNASNSILGTGENVTINTGGAMVFGSSFVDTNIPAALDRIVAASTGTVAADNYASTNFDFNTPALSAARLGAVGTVSYTGTLTPQGTVYRLGGGGGTLTMANTNALTGAGNSLVVQGNVVLPGVNDYDSGTTLGSGTLTLGDAGSLGTGGLTITGGTIAANGTVATTNTIAANGDFSIGGTGTLTLGGNMTLNANRIITNNNTTAATTFGAISGNTRTLTFSGNGSTTISGNITTTTGTLIKNGTGILTLDGANTNSGTTTVNGGILVFSGSNSSAGGTTLEAATLQLDSDSNGGLASGTLNMNQNAGVLQAINADRAISNNVTLNSSPTISGSQSLTINGTITINNNRTLTNNISGTGKLLTLSNITRDGSNNRNLVLTGTGDTTVNGTVVLGTGTFTKNGDGTVTLNNSNTYTGATMVSKGTLNLTGASQGTSSITVQSGAKLGFTLDSPVTAPSAAVFLTNGTVKITGTVNNSSGYKLLTAASFDVTPTLDSPIANYTLQLQNTNTELWLVYTGTASPYGTWAGGAGFGADANGDGIDNGMAFVLGATNVSENALARLPEVGTEPGFLTLTFDRVNPIGAITLNVDYGGDLTFPQTDVIPANGGTLGSGVVVVVTPGSPDQVVVKIPNSFASAKGSLFARLRAVQN